MNHEQNIVYLIEEVLVFMMKVSFYDPPRERMIREILLKDLLVMTNF